MRKTTKGIYIKKPRRIYLDKHISLKNKTIRRFMLYYENRNSYIQGETERLQRLKGANIPETGVVLKVLAPGENQDRQSNQARYLITHEVDNLPIDFDGIIGDRHHRTVRPTTGRERSIYPKGTIIRESRHVFAISPYDCRVLTERLGVEVTPELLGVNLVIGRDDGEDYSLTELPMGTRILIFNELVEPRPVTLVNYTKQQGCGNTGNTLAVKYNDKSLTQRFMAASKDNRGIVCCVEQAVENASIRKGQKILFKFPKGITP